MKKLRLPLLLKWRDRNDVDTTALSTGTACRPLHAAVTCFSFCLLVLLLTLPVVVVRRLESRRASDVVALLLRNKERKPRHARLHGVWSQVPVEHTAGEWGMHAVGFVLLLLTLPAPQTYQNARTQALTKAKAKKDKQLQKKYMTQPIPDLDSFKPPFHAVRSRVCWVVGDATDGRIPAPPQSIPQRWLISEIHKQDSTLQYLQVLELHDKKDRMVGRFESFNDASRCALNEAQELLKVYEAPSPILAILSDPLCFPWSSSPNITPPHRSWIPSPWVKRFSQRGDIAPRPS
jgi:hypothetical protein